MNAEQELVFAKFLVRTGLADAHAVKQALRRQARRSSEGQRPPLSDVLVELGLVKAEALSQHAQHFERHLKGCESCQAYFYDPPPSSATRCKRCSSQGGGLGPTGMTGQFRRAQRGDVRTPGGSTPARDGNARGARGADEHRRSAAPPGHRAPSGDGLQEVGGYTVIEAIGRGGMGVVYKARHKRLGRIVALKVLREAQRQSESHVRRFQREAQSVAKLCHPNIVQIHEFGEEDGIYFFTMDLVEGPSLDDRLGRLPQDLRRAVEIARDSARGLACAHQNGVVHRDIKPGNILLDLSGRARLTDFGLARNVDNQSKLTQEGELIGTPLYMSPEQVRGRVQEIDARSDVYSLGVVLYQAVTGRLPFLAQTMVDLQYRILHDELPSPRSLNPTIDVPLETILRKCLEKEREARYQHGAELADDLDRWLSGKRIVARPPSLQGRLVRRIRKHRRASLTAAIIAVGLLIGGGWIGLRELGRQEQDARDRIERLATQLETRARALIKSALAALDQAETELRRGRVTEAQSAVDRAGAALRDLEALTAEDLPATRVASVREQAGLLAAHRRWLRTAAEIDLAFQTRAKITRAEERLAHLAQETPGDADTWLLLARARLLLDRRDGASEAVQRALAIAPDRADARGLSGRIAAARGHWSDAEAELTKALAGLSGIDDAAASQTTFELRLLRARTRLALRRLDEALRDAEAAARSRPRAPQALVVRGEVHRVAGRRFQAARDFDRAVDLSDDDDVEALLHRGRFLLDQGYLSRALDDLETVIATDDTALEAYLWRGVAGYLTLEGLGTGQAEDRPSRSEGDLLRVARADTATPSLAAQAWRWLGRLRRARGAAREAAAAYRQARTLEPGDEAALIGLGRAAAEAGAVEEAKAVLEEALARRRSIDALVARGMAALAAGDPKGAVLVLEPAVEMAPASPEGQAALGQAYARLGDETRSRAAFQAALRGRFDAADIRSFFRLGRKHMALASQREATHLARARSLRRAAEAFTACVRLAPRFARAHIERAKALGALGAASRPESLAACADAIRANPEALEAYLVRARLRLESKTTAEHERAAADLERALRLGARAAAYRKLLGRAYLSLGKAKEAVEVLEAAVKAAPGDAEAFSTLGDAREKAGDAPGAARARDRGRALRERGADAEVEALVERGVRLRRTEPRTAAQIFSQAIALSPTTARLYLERYQAYLLALDPYEAIADLARGIVRDPKLGHEMTRHLAELTSPLDWREALRRAETHGSSNAHRVAGERWFLIGLLYVLRVESGDPAPADPRRGVEAFSRFLDVSPTNAAGYYLRGMLLLRAGDLSAAKNDLQLALLLDGKAPSVHVYLAGVQAQKGRLQLAMGTLRRAITLGYRDWPQLTRDPALAPLRSLPAWKELLKGR